MVKNYYSKTKNAVSAFAVSAVLLGSIFTTPSWGMEEQDLEDKSPFARVPAEVETHIFGFLPLKSQGHVSLVCMAWKELANDENGAFKDLHAFKKTYKEQKEFVRKSPDPTRFCHALSNLRKSVQLLSLRSLEKPTWFVTQLFDELKTKASKTGNFTNSESDPVTIWASLALLRACDRSWASDIKEWLENIVVPGLQRQLVTEDTKDALTLLGATTFLKERQKKLASFCRPYLFPEELCERDQLENNSAFKGSMVCDSEMYLQSPLKCHNSLFEEYYKLTGQIFSGSYLNTKDYFRPRNLTLAAKYFTAVLDGHSNLNPVYDSDAADTFFLLENWELAAKYYAISIEKDPDEGAYFYLNAGYAEAKSNQLKKAAGYFERFMDDTGANGFNEKLCSDTLDLMKKALTDNNSDIRFHEWIDVVRSKNLETTPVPLEKPIGVNPGI